MRRKNVYIAQQTEEYDAIVVGSGITGGWAAKELCEKGLKTLVLERGRHVEHGTDYVTENKAPWEYAFRGLGDAALYRDEYQVQSKCYAFGEATQHFFVNDKENPYTSAEGKPFNWFRGYHLGGRSLTWGRQCYRWSAIDFEANAKDGFGVPWPIGYDDIAPWYEYTERFVGISGQPEGLSQLPDGHFLPPMEMNCAELKLKEGVESAFEHRMVTIGRAAHLTQPHNGRAPCQYRNRCYQGCSYGAYFSSLSATLPAALATGNLTIRADSIVHEVIYDEELDKAVGVRVRDAKTMQDVEYRGKIIFLCASALNSAYILLNSKTPRFSDGLANSSGAVGHYLMDHHFEVGARATRNDLNDHYFYGRRPNGIYVPRFRNISRQTEHKDFVRGYGFQGGATRASWARGTDVDGFGADWKHALREPGPWEIWMGAWGECLPRYDNYVELNDDVRDAWDLPTLTVNCTWGENEYAMRKDMEQTAAELLEASGWQNIETFDDAAPPGHCIHEMGTARMGNDPQTSVLNGNNQAHDVPNLFITDGACMTSSACQNPSITYMALTARSADFAVEALKRGEL